jgi:hypothetical protein
MNYFHVLIGMAIYGLVFWIATMILVPAGQRIKGKHWWFFATGAATGWLVTVVLGVLE